MFNIFDTEQEDKALEARQKQMQMKTKDKNKRNGKESPPSFSKKTCERVSYRSSFAHTSCFGQSKTGRVSNTGRMRKADRCTINELFWHLYYSK